MFSVIALTMVMTILVMVGCAADNGYVVHPNTVTETKPGRIIESRSEHTSTLLKDGLVLITGGFDIEYRPMSRVEIYDPNTRLWAETASLRESRAQHAAMLLEDGRVIVTGGIGASFEPLS